MTDRGIGISPDDVDRIFARFERAVSMRHYGGLGLGLYVTRNIVEAHGGSIYVSSSPNEGSTFTVESSEAHGGAGANRRRHGVVRMTERSCDAAVMVVEDDAAIRESISEVLADNEYASIEVANGKEAFERLRAGPTKPCVILLDIMMPEMDGWQFRALQRQDPELKMIPVVVLTAHTDIAEVEKGMQPNACLRKPVQLDNLMAILERFCRRTSDV